MPILGIKKKCAFISYYVQILKQGSTHYLLSEFYLENVHDQNYL